MSKGVVDCNTIFSCLNLDAAPATVTVQYFDAASSTQAGVDVTLTIGPGVAVNVGGRGTPVNFFQLHSHAGIDFVDGKARVCSGTARLACQGFYLCADTQPAPPDGSASR